MSVKIKEMSREFTKVEKYLMTSSPSIVSMKDVEDGTSIPVDGYLVFVDTKDDGQEDEILSIITPDKQVYSCQSATFKRSIYDISDVMEGCTFAVIKTSGKTKNGRDYINCYLDILSINE